MRRVCMTLLLLCMTLISSVCMARTVEVTGVGASRNEALNDAMRSALEIGVGSLVDSNTIVQNATLIEDNIYAVSKGFVNNINVLEEGSTGGDYRVKIRADVDTQADGKLMNELTKLFLMDIGLRNVKIAVVIPEEHIRYRIPDPAGETAVVKKFIDNGFMNMIDISQERLALNQPYNFSEEQMQNLANSMNADILVVGKAFSEGVGDVGQFINGKRTGVVSCKARVEAKMYFARTGQIIAAHGTYGSAADISESIAAKKALAKAGEEMGDYLVESILNRAASNRQLVEMTVLTNDVAAINTIKRDLNAVNGVRNVQFNTYANGRGVLTIQYSGAPQTLYNALERVTERSVELRESTFNSLVISVR